MNYSLGNWLKEKVNANIYSWKSNTLYEIDNVVLVDNVLFRCLTRHVSGVFIDDKDKWLAIDSSGGSSDSGLTYKQVTKMGVSTETSVSIPIKETVTFTTAPVEVLKFKEGEKNKVVNLLTFDSGDGSRFNYAEGMVTFDGKVNLNYTHNIPMTKPSMVTDGTTTGYISESAEVDLSIYKNVVNIGVE